METILLERFYGQIVENNYFIFYFTFHVTRKYFKASLKIRIIVL